MKRLQPISAAIRHASTARILAIAAVGVALLSTPACAGPFGSSKTNLTPEMKGKWRGTWDSRHTYEFERNGDVKGWWDGLSMSVVGTWKRDGTRITVKMNTKWDFVGEIRDGEIRGQVTIGNGVPGATPIDEKWKRE
jgi:hypothetical protein